MNPLEVQFCTCAGLRKAGRVLTKFYEEALKESDLKPTQFTLLATLDQVGPVTMGELAEWMVTDRTTLTRNLKLLQQRDWVGLIEGDDRRRRQVKLTDKGQKIYQDTLPMWQQAQQQVVERLGQQKWKTLLSLLGESVERLHPV